MSSPWLRSSFSHVRIFSISLAVVVLALAGLLFGVRMEAITPATGSITARDLYEVRSLSAGLVEPGWYEGEVPRPGGEAMRVRLDAQGNGLARSGQDPSVPVQRGEVPDGAKRWPVGRDGLPFHP